MATNPGLDDETPFGYVGGVGDSGGGRAANRGPKEKALVIPRMPESPARPRRLGHAKEVWPPCFGAALGRGFA
jgi:hypothetical protein